MALTIRKLLWLPLIVSFEVLLVTLYAVSVHLNGGEPFPLLDVNGYRTLPSWFQAIQLFLMGAIPFWMYCTYPSPPSQNLQVPPSRNLLVFTALLFFYASMDELFKFNILFGQHQLWKGIYLSLGLAVPILFRRVLLRLWRLSPKAMRSIGIGIVTFVAGGFGLDLFRVYVQQPYWYQLFGQWQFYQVDSIRTAFEELAEMLGETLVISGMLGLMRQRRIQFFIESRVGSGHKG